MAGSSPIDFVIGFLVSLGASTLNALGLNLLKLDHVRNSKKLESDQRHDCGRPMWHFGLYLYIASQLIGSTIALNFLKTQWVAPLGSAALIFNFIFAKMLVGTKIAKKDILGTCVVVASVIWIVVFGGMNNGEDPEENLSLDSLKALYLRPLFAIYFGGLNLITFTGLCFAIYATWASADEQRRSKVYVIRDLNPDTMKKTVAICMSVVGGLLASETLLLAKSGVKLFVISVSTGNNQFTDSISIFILIALLITAILQVYCLNTSLKLYSSVVVVPTFYGTYTAMGLINSIIYMDEIGTYPAWAIALVLVGIAVLIYGVMLLSGEKAEKLEEQPSTTSQIDPAVPYSSAPEELGDMRIMPLPSVPDTAKTYVPSDYARGKHTRMFSSDDHEFNCDLSGISLRDSGETVTGTLLRKDNNGRMIVDSTSTNIYGANGPTKLKGAKAVAHGFKSIIKSGRFRYFSPSNSNKESSRSLTLPMENTVPDYNSLEAGDSSIHYGHLSSSSSKYVQDTEEYDAYLEAHDTALRRRAGPADASDSHSNDPPSNDLHLDMLKSTSLDRPNPDDDHTK
ncbi:hypothetical protein NQZ79_g8215 [Umbelopsis isabellina]|nr:hypothetical protein NQZ79_g8215 [Umbelopsis isabellina]